ncbi:unnamed protein product [Miscanthus lutarioriparius]|uniref:Uncharacterized protein n=1 Tax=Miscanthus lutarioriparius TaxID=422564 RepID=A0A811S8Y4_9POAL|nr:unnamed protein product [Miscanthus lutarioriparius]
MAMEETSRMTGREKGGLRTMPFIFANEVAEKLAVVGFSTNMLTYLTTQLHMPLAKAATTLTNFGGTSAATPLIGAFLADACIGRFWTIAAASVVYQVVRHGAPDGVSGAAAVPPAVVQAGRRGDVPGGRAVAAGGAVRVPSPERGGRRRYRPCIVAFGADQFDESRAAERARSWGFFNWYYFCNGASMLLAVTAVVYVQDNVGWGWGLGVPAFCMGVSVAAFVAGYPMYRRLEPAGSPFTRLAQVVVAAVKKRWLPAADVDPARLYENDELDVPISMYGKLVHTDQLSFFDRAAIVTDGDLVTLTDADSGKPSPAPVPNPWRLSTVHRVEELKSVIRMGPIWAAGILVITGSSTQHTFSLQQASTMDRRLAPGLTTFQIPAGSMTVFGLLAMLLTLFVYDSALVRVARRFTGLDRGISFLHRMGVGFAISVLATLVAGFVERHRRDAAAVAAGATDAGTSPLSAYWLVPQYALHGVAEAFTSVGHLEFMYDQAPESMRSTATALFWLSISLGSYASTLLVMNLLYYAICAKRFRFKPVQLHKEEEEGGKAIVELQEKVDQGMQGGCSGKQPHNIVNGQMTVDSFVDGSLVEAIWSGPETWHS